MHKQFLAATTLLALLCGCDHQEEETVAGSPQPQTTSAGTPSPLPKGSSIAHVPATGEQVYRNTCSICHRLGLRGAPRLGDEEDWKLRLTHGKEVLYVHAVKGYRGNKGFMPSRGSNAKLSENEVKAAVDYMVWYSVPASHGSFGSHMFPVTNKPSTIR